MLELSQQMEKWSSDCVRLYLSILWIERERGGGEGGGKVGEGEGQGERVYFGTGCIPTAAGN